jgi:hypothetical protein
LWGVPLTEEKTVVPIEVLTFLGVEFDTQKLELKLPLARLVDIKTRLEYCINLKKITIHELQSLIGLLTFACQVGPWKGFLQEIN